MPPMRFSSRKRSVPETPRRLAVFSMQKTTNSVALSFDGLIIFSLFAPQSYSFFLNHHAKCDDFCKKMINHHIIFRTHRICRRIDRSRFNVRESTTEFNFRKFFDKEKNLKKLVLLPVALFFSASAMFFRLVSYPNSAAL